MTRILPLIYLITTCLIGTAVFQLPNPISLLKDEYKLPGGLLSPFKEYDFIVIGAGSTGSVIASRLSEERNWNVLLLEAGEGESFFSSIPLASPLLFNTQYSWTIPTISDSDVCLGYQAQDCSSLAGRAVGGSSVINALFYTRGTKRDWDTIAGLGNPGWSYDDMKPYFEKFEVRNLSHARSKKRPPFINVETVKPISKYAKMFLEAAKDLGNGIRDNNEHANSFYYPLTNQLNGRRFSTAKAYLYPFRNRKNLHILPLSRVTKINIDKNTKTAHSVEYIRNGMYFNVTARKEIIVSAGALLSPHLLMISGIGPGEELNAVGIEVIQDSKVGYNLQNHISMLTTFLTNEPKFDKVSEVARILFDAGPWFFKGRGSLTVPLAEAVGFFNTNVTNSDPDYRDGEINLVTLPLHLFISSIMRVDQPFFDSAYNEFSLNDTHRLAFSMTVLNTKSRGRVRLISKNPFALPRLYPNYLKEKIDMDTFIALLRYSQKIVGTETFKKIGSKYYFPTYSTCFDKEVDSDEYWECALRSFPLNYHHYAGTCKMGPETDPQAVVDPELRVYGIKNLRVSDISILPNLISGHTNGPAMAIGEKTAEIIRNTWKDQNNNESNNIEKINE